MNRKILIIIVIIVTAVVASGIYVLTRKDSQSSQSTGVASPSETINSSTNNTSGSEPSQKGKYVEYAASTFTADTSATKILFFHAPWCPQCRALDKDIRENNIPDGVTIYKVDYDTNQNLRKQYGVTLQTTVVKVDSNGTLVAKYIPYDNPTFDNVINNIL
jgi:thiol-disulfide isomerase/thioredoxin